MGFLAGINASRFSLGLDLIPPPPETALGALIGHIQNTDRKTFQPMNVTFGLFPPLPDHVRKKDRGIQYARRSLDALASWQMRITGMYAETSKLRSVVDRWPHLRSCQTASASSFCHP